MKPPNDDIISITIQSYLEEAQTDHGLREKPDGRAEAAGRRDHVEEILLQEDGLILARGSGLLGPDYQIYEDGKLYAHFLDRAVAEKQYGEIKELRNKTKGR